VEIFLAILIALSGICWFAAAATFFHSRWAKIEMDLSALGALIVGGIFFGALALTLYINYFP